MPSAPVSTHTAGAAISDARSGLALYKQASSIFGGKGSKSGASGDGGDFWSDTDANAAPNVGGKGISGNGSMSSSGFTENNVIGAAGGALGLYSAYQGNGGFGGAASGAMSGMQLGMMVGGPMGAAIGAAAGAVIGAVGFGGREKARVYDLKQVRPQIAQDLQTVGTGGDYLSTYSDLQSLDVTAEHTTKSMGPAAHAYYNDTIRTEIAQARGKLDQMEKAGRSNFGMSAASYDIGSDFIPKTGLNLNHQGERIIPSDKNERITRALENGADMETVAKNYRTAMKPAAAQRAPTWSGGDTHVHLNAIDTKTGVDWLMDNRHTIRAANNASYAENSGGADAGF